MFLKVPKNLTFYGVFKSSNVFCSPCPIELISALERSGVIAAQELATTPTYPKSELFRMKSCYYCNLYLHLLVEKESY